MVHKEQVKHGLVWVASSGDEIKLFFLRKSRWSGRGNICDSWLAYWKKAWFGASGWEKGFLQSGCVLEGVKFGYIYL